MLFIGITGGVGAGKSEILNFIQTNYNSKVMLTDEIAHELMEPGTDCYAKLAALFEEKGKSDVVYNADGTFHRQNLATVIFAEEEIRTALNAIVHPAVKQYVRAQYEMEKQAGRLDLLVVESALLIEDQYDQVCEELWYIYTSEENRRVRLKASRGYSDAKIQKMFDSQLSEAVFRSHAKEVIDNNHTQKETFSQIRHVLKTRGIHAVKLRYRRGTR